MPGVTIKPLACSQPDRWFKTLDQLGEVQRFASLVSSETQLLIGLDSSCFSSPEVIVSENVFRYYRIYVGIITWIYKSTYGEIQQ